MANKILQLHRSSDPNNAPRVEVWHDYDAQSHNLSIAFCVVQNEDFHCNEEFKNSPFNWKLWEWDVVEAFLQLRSDEEDKNAPYLEIQVSPLNQRLLLIITKPRQKFYSPLNFDFESKTTITKGKWETKIEMKLPQEHLGSGKLLYGNFFACLGEGQKRRFFAQVINQDKEPNFHIPENFTKITE